MKITLSLPEWTIVKMYTQANKHNMSVSEYVEYLLQKDGQAQETQVTEKIEEETKEILLSLIR